MLDRHLRGQTPGAALQKKTEEGRGRKLGELARGVALYHSSAAPVLYTSFTIAPVITMASDNDDEEN